jgi:hypothetical protein
LAAANYWFAFMQLAFREHSHQRWIITECRWRFRAGPAQQLRSGTARVAPAYAESVRHPADELPNIPGWLRRHLLAALLAASCLVRPAAADVLTAHADAMRTGWYNRETVLSPSTVGDLTRLYATRLDGTEVQTQPLVRRGNLYVATQGDNLYRISLATGAILAQRSFGPAVTAVPSDCPASTQAPIEMGITSTPAFSASGGSLYLIAVAMENGAPVLRVHAVDPLTLADQIAPPVIAPQGTLLDGTVYSFDPVGTRQRSALLLSGGNLYAGFFAHCDYHDAKRGRGWLLGWDAATLRPLQSRLDNRRTNSPGDFFLTSIWMSGAGAAGDESGNVYVATGNSDGRHITYGATNRSESVLKFSADLSELRGYFTPSALPTLEAGDLDLGSGGIMLLPAQASPTPPLLVAAGKSGTMYLLDRRALGGYQPADKAIAEVPIGACWCAESYYQGADNAGRIVASGGDTLAVWRVGPGAPPTLTEDVAFPALPTRATGFFTAVSSDGAAGTLIWALTRPTSASVPAMLYAFDPANPNAPVVSVPVNAWPLNHNQNAMPVIADGHVIVATYGQVAVFGLPGRQVTGDRTRIERKEDTWSPSPRACLVHSKERRPRAKMSA